MPITGQGWEIWVQRIAEQRHPKSGKRRTVGSYQVFHDGNPQAGLKGWTTEAKGPGANRPEGNGLRIEAGRYPLATWGGQRYVTYGYADPPGPNTWPKPALELRATDQRTEILIHPGRNFLSSVGCINLTARLTGATQRIDARDSHERVVALIEDLRAYVIRFPAANGRPVPRAFAVVEGEP
jgi:hypothetical protein